MLDELPDDEEEDMNSLWAFRELGFSKEKIFLIKRSDEPGCCCSKRRNEFFKSSNFGVSTLFELTCEASDELRYFRARLEKIGDNTLRYVFDVGWCGWLDEDCALAVLIGWRFSWSDDWRVWFWINEETGGLDTGTVGGLLLCLLSFTCRSGYF